MNRVANFALRFAIRAAVDRRELKCVVLPLQAKLEAGRCGGESAERFPAGWLAPTLRPLLERIETLALATVAQLTDYLKNPAPGHSRIEADSRRYRRIGFATRPKLWAPASWSGEGARTPVDCGRMTGLSLMVLLEVFVETGNHASDDVAPVLWLSDEVTFVG